MNFINFIISIKLMNILLKILVLLHEDRELNNLLFFF